MYRFVVIILVFTQISVDVSSSSSSIGSRSLLRTISDDKGISELHDVVVELNDTNFKDVLREAPSPFALVEFFAHWLVLLFFGIIDSIID